MEYVDRGYSGLKMSRVGFGCAAISGHDYGPVDDRESAAAIRAAWDAGVTLFDTADVYGFGRAEEVLAKALGRDRHEAVIITKFGIRWDESGRTSKDCSVKHLTLALEASLRRLQLDCIPIYMVHWHDGATPFAEFMQALKASQEQGKIRYIGCSNFSHEMVRQACETHRIDVLQLPYSLVRREHEPQLTEAAGRMRMLTVVHDVLARGLLSGKYETSAQFGEHDTRSRDKYFSGARLDAGLQLVRRLESVGRRHAKTPAQVAIRWALGRPFVDSVLVGSKRQSQVAENTDMFGWSLTPEDRVELEQAGLD